MKIEVKNGGVREYDETAFAKAECCSVVCLNTIDKITKQLSNDYPIDEEGCLIGNTEEHYCGRWYLEDRSIWVGRYFDAKNAILKNKLVVGFFIPNSKTNESINFLFNKSTISDIAKQHKLQFIIQEDLKDQGEWIYIILNKIFNFCITKAYKKIKDLIWGALCKSFSYKSPDFNSMSNIGKGPKRFHYWLTKSICILISILFVTLMFLAGNYIFREEANKKNDVIVEKVVIDNSNFHFLEDKKSECNQTVDETIKKCKSSFSMTVCFLIYLIIIVLGIILIIYLLKDNLALRLEKLNDLNQIQQYLFREDFSDEFNETESYTKKNKTVSKSSKRADLLKHYMTCVTEL